MTISAIRAALATSLETVNGLRPVAYVTDQVKSAQATIRRTPIQYDLVLGGSRTTFMFEVIVYRPRTAEVAAQKFLDDLCEPSGSGSLKQAVEENAALHTVVQYAWVKSVSEVQTATVGGIEYLTVTFNLEVVA